MIGDRLAGRMDGWQNLITGMGNTQKDPRLASRYVRRSGLGGYGLDRDQIEAMYEEDPIFARIVDAIPENATRRWIRVQGTMDEDGTADDDFGRSVLDALDELDAQGAFYELMRLDRLDGGAAMIIGADDGQSPDKPLNHEAIQRVAHLNVVSRWEIMPGPPVTDPSDPDFRKPEFYTFVGSAMMGDDPMAKIHHSRVIRLCGIKSSDRRMLQNQGWGIPLADRLYESIRQFGTAYEYTEAMLKDMVQGVMTIEGLSDLIASEAGNELILKRLSVLHLAASAFNAVLLDKGETYERRTVSSGGVSDLLVRFMDKLAAVAQMPLSILFGQPPTGLSTDDKAGRATFYDSIATQQRRLLNKPINRVIEALLNAQDGPTGGQLPAQWAFDFLPLNEPSEKEEAETDLIKANVDQVLVNIGAITEAEARSRQANDPQSPYQLDLETGEAEAEVNAAVGADPQGLEGLRAVEDPEAVAASEAVQQVALSGIQVTAAQGIVDAVSKGQLPFGSGLAMLQLFFGLSDEQATKIMAPVQGFTPTAEAAPAPPDEPVIVG